MILVTEFADTAATTKQERTFTPEELPRLVSSTAVAESKSGLPLIKFARFGDDKTARGSYRCNKNVVEVYGAEGDYDAGLVPFNIAAFRLEESGLFAQLYTTPSHTLEKPRWRVLVPFSRPYCDRMADRRSAAIRLLESVLDAELAKESHTLSQAFYLGRLFDNEYRYRTFFGDFIDQRVTLPEPREIVAPQRSLDTSSSEVAEILSYVSPDCAYPDWVSVGMGLHEKFAGSEEGLELWDQWSAGSRKYRPGECSRKWRTFRGHGVGFGTVATLARMFGADLSSISRKHGVIHGR